MGGGGMSENEYLGDGVYVGFDGYGVILQTGLNIEDDSCENQIYLEPNVMARLNDYVKRIKLEQER